MWGKTAVRSMTLYELLGKMQPRARQDKFEFAEFWDVMEKRGFGPMLALPSFIACTPIGAIPGIPSLAGGTILLIALQILLGRRHPWLPQKVMQLNCDADQLRYIVEKVKPYAVRVDRFFSSSVFFHAPACVQITHRIMLCRLRTCNDSSGAYSLYGPYSRFCCFYYGNRHGHRRWCCGVSWCFIIAIWLYTWI